ncbi:MAG: nickel pincer cofactor biosynthesis protein LarC [Candidatus Limnocylindrales bacterium]
MIGSIGMEEIGVPVPAPAERIGFLDCYSGISGDMVLGALVDAGVPLAHLSAVLDGLSLAGSVRLESEVVQRGVLRATRVQVIAAPHQPHRTLRDLAALLEAAALDETIRSRSLAVLSRIAEVEGRIHGQPTDEVELHEVGAIDSVADVVGAVAGFAYLGIARLYASSVPAGPGSIAGGHHGQLPLPAPATLALLAAAGAPIRPFGAGHELVTPTGAALLATLARFEQPPMVIRTVGYGAGQAELPWPNVLRLWVGEPIPDPGAEHHEHVVLETNVDDMSPQLLAPVADVLLAAGALDVTLGPLLMKKGRSGALLSVVARAQDEEALAELLLRETTTLGVRVHAVRRHEADRSFETVETRFGPVTVKLKRLHGQVVGAMPEFESVRQRALAAGAPLALVHAAAAAAADALLVTLATAPDAPGAR